MSMATAEIVSVGTEILMGQIADTNAQHLGKLFPELGIRHVSRQTVGDNLERLTEALRLALSRADVVITIGGLGPTQDDLTREGIAAALDDTLVVDDHIVEHIRNLFAVRKITWTEAQIRQARRPTCGRPIDNPNGTAPGLICEKDGKAVIALPGPKNEFKPMVDGPVRQYLARFSGSQVIHSRLLRICGLGESAVEARLVDLVGSTNPTLATYAKPGEVHLRITASAPTTEAAESLIQPVESIVRAALGTAVFGVDETTLEQATLEILKARKQTLAVAESITGGGLGRRITSVPGSSAAFLGGVIAYSSAVKRRDLGIDPNLLEDPEIGPVSAQVAEQMAEGVRKRLAADYAVALTGNAGPTVDRGGKPVGLVYIAVASPQGVSVEEYKFRGIREDIRDRATQFALTQLRQVLLEGVYR